MRALRFSGEMTSAVRAAARSAVAGPATTSSSAAPLCCARPPVLAVAQTPPAARRLIEARPRSLSQDEARRADAVRAALLAGGLLNSNYLGNSLVVAAATRDGLTSLAHVLDEARPGRGAGQLLLFAERDAFTPFAIYAACRPAGTYRTR